VSCPICRRPAAEPYRPFCSKRCADVDLGRWLTGAYAIPAEDADEADDTGTDAGTDRSAGGPPRTDRPPH
jgi:endogenous inhibitor of DNA gyrase (YacG/DUF329 family)